MLTPCSVYPLIRRHNTIYHNIHSSGGRTVGGILCRPDDGQDVRSPGQHGRREVDQEADLERRTMQPAGSVEDLTRVAKKKN